MMEKQKEEYQIMNQKKIYPQQRVLLSEPNSPMLLAKMGALWEQNAIPCLLSPSMNRPNREHCISLLQKEPYGQQQEALILFTSGTSSLPKGVVLSHTNLTSQLEMLHQHSPMKLLHDHSRSVALLPWTHCYGLIGECLMMMQRGGSLSPLPKFNIFHYLREQK
jgi:long-subunit acyl-CoA synthetase (AMP-forming)